MLDVLQHVLEVAPFSAVNGLRRPIDADRHVMVAHSHDVAMTTVEHLPNGLLHGVIKRNTAFSSVELEYAFGVRRMWRIWDDLMGRGYAAGFRTSTEEITYIATSCGLAESCCVTVRRGQSKPGHLFLTTLCHKVMRPLAIMM